MFAGGDLLGSGRGRALGRGVAAALGMRWALLAAALAEGARCLFFTATLGRMAAAAACGLAWAWLSRCKALSLDRESLGIPPRR